MTKYLNPTTRNGGVEHIVVPPTPSTTLVDEAPYDDEQYVRINGEWVPVDTPEIVPDTMPPAAPTGLNSSGTVNANGSSVSYELNWTGPSTNMDGSPLTDFSYYVVRWHYAGGGPWFSFVSNEPSSVISGVELARDVEWEVLARDISGNDSAWASHTTAGITDNVGPEKPSQLILDSKLATVFARWDGFDYLGGPPPPDFSHIEIYMSATTGGPWVHVGRLTGASSIITGDVVVGETRFFTAIAYDTSGNYSLRSAEASVVVEGVVDLDIDQAVFDAIDADIAASASTTVTTAQDLANQAEANAINTTSSRVTAGTVIAGKVAVNSIGAENIKTKAITADAVAIGSQTNMLAGGVGEFGGMGGTVFGQLATATIFDTVDKPSDVAGVFGCAAGAGTSQTGSTVYAWDVEPGSEYLVEIWLKADKPSSKMYIDVRDNNGVLVPHVAVGNLPYAGGTSRPVDNQVVPTTWTKYYAVAKPGATATKMRISAVYFNHPSGTERTAVQKLAMRVRQRNAGQLIVDGAITASKILANEIVGTHIKSDEIAANHIKANAITANKIMAGAIDGFLITGPRIRTAATGQRTELGLDPGQSNRIDFYSGRSEEIYQGGIYADASQSGSILLYGTDVGAGRSSLLVGSHIWGPGDIEQAVDIDTDVFQAAATERIDLAVASSAARVTLDPGGSTGTAGVGVRTTGDIDMLASGAVDIVGNAGPTEGWVRVDTAGLDVKTGKLTVAGDEVRLANDPYIRALLATDNSQSPASGTWTTITGWTVPAESSSGITRSGGIFTVAKAGSYMLTIGISFAANGTGIRGVRPLINGAGGQNALFATPGATFQGYAALNQEVYLAANSTVAFQAYQNSGGALALRGDAGGLYSTCSIRRVGR